VQGRVDRSAALTRVPARRQDLFAYGRLIANVEGDYFTRAQLTMLSDFVAERGGGLAVLGGRSFAKRGLSGTPLEEVLPVELSDRRGGIVRTAMTGDMPAHNKLMLTGDGETHPISASARRATKRASAGRAAGAGASAALRPRPGATILALTTAPAAASFRSSRSSVTARGVDDFCGRGLWRWKMMMPSSERAHEFSGVTARWLNPRARSRWRSPCPRPRSRGRGVDRR
jgi:hypothetical protein